MNDERTFYIALGLTFVFLVIAGPLGFLDWIEAQG